MEIEEEEHKGIVGLRLKGRLDANSANLLKASVASHIASQHFNFVVDLQEIKFIDSTGIGSLVASLRLVNKGGGNIKISGLQDEARGIFELTRLHRLFEIFDAPEQAYEYF